jgi:hypothetical protein
MPGKQQQDQPQGAPAGAQQQGGDAPQQQQNEPVTAADQPREEVQAGVDEALSEVAERYAPEQEQGYRGDVTDPTPNENYTVQGVTSGAPTPETDPGLAEEAGSARFRGSAIDPARQAAEGNEGQ